MAAVRSVYRALYHAKVCFWETKLPTEHVTARITRRMIANFIEEMNLNIFFRTGIGIISSEEP